MSGATENTTLWRDLNKLSLSLCKTCATMHRMYRHTLGQRIVGKNVNLLADWNNQVDQLPNQEYNSELIERYCRRINSHLGLPRQYNTKEFVRRLFDEHPALRLYYSWEDCTVKIICKSKELDQFDGWIWNQAMDHYHKQFRNGTEVEIRIRKQHVF